MMGSIAWRADLFFSVIILLVGLSAGQTFPDLTQCGQGVGCLRNPTYCSSSDSCTSVLRWYKTNDSNFIGFDLMAISDGWAAVGFSFDNRMTNDSVVTCVRNMSDNGNVKVGLAYNPATYDVPYMTNNSMQFLKGENGSFVNGRIICSFQRSINGDNSWVFPLNSPYYLLLGYGPVNASGTVMMHSVVPVVSPITVNVVTDYPDFYPPTIPAPPATTPTPGSNIYVNDGDGSQVTFTPMPGTNQVLINMTRPMIGSSGWLGLGFSYDQTMADDSVIDCILKQDGTMIVKHSYNNRMNNSEIPLPGANEGISNANLSSANGVLQCVFQRQINGLTNPQIYCLDRPYFIMVAHGQVNSQGVKQKHDWHYVTAQNMTVASSPSSPMSYFRDNDGNVASFRYLRNSSEVEFQIKGPVNGSARWIALGFSIDDQMGGDSVLDCILLKNGTIIVQHSYNVDNDNWNYALNSSEGITVTGTSYENGTLSCSFRRNATGFSDSRIYSLNRPYYLLLGKGPVSDDGIKWHHEKIPTISATADDIRWCGNVMMKPVPDMEMTTASTPAVSAPGWSTFNDPAPGNIVQFRLAPNGTYVEFTIQRPSPSGGSGWVAVGFAAKPNMVNSSVVDCILTSNGTFKVQLSYNEPVGAFNDVLGNPDSAIIDIVTENKDGIMKCNFKRKVSNFTDNRIFPFNTIYHLLLASGPLKSDGATKDYHSNKVASSNTFNLTSTDGLNASASGRRYSNAPDPIRLLRAHAVLMLTTFVMLMSGAIILARYYKTCWPDNKICGTGVWFAVHRFMMVLGLFCCAAGFIIIFCYSDGFLYRGFPSGSPSYYWVHGPLGIVVMCLIIINPIMAIFRCDPDHDSRWIYNWLHFTVGMCCQILAGITLFFGIKMGEQYYNLQHWSVFWILIAFVSFHVFIEFILIIEKLVAQRFTKQSFVITYGMSGPGEETSAVKSGEGMVTQESLVFRYCALTLYTAVTMALWLAMIILIGGGFWV